MTEEKVHFPPRQALLASFVLLALGFQFAQAEAQDAVSALRSRKAILITETVSHFEGDTRSLGRITFEASFQQCNAFRQSVYKLPPQTLPEDALHALDTTREEHLYDGSGYAMTRTTAHAIELTDKIRWVKEMATNNAAGRGAFPDRAPDCASYRLIELRDATLWRAGKRYQLDYQKKRAVLQRGRPVDITPQALPSPLIGSQLPQRSVIGQTCSESGPVQALPNALGVTEQCVWNDYGAVAWMNLPLSLRRTLYIGAAKKQIGETVAQSADPNPSFTSDTFAIPADFSVIERPSPARTTGDDRD